MGIDHGSEEQQECWHLPKYRHRGTTWKNGQAKRHVREPGGKSQAANYLLLKAFSMLSCTLDAPENVKLKLQSRLKNGKIYQVVSEVVVVHKLCQIQQ
jgi:hypothetical protein